MLAKIFSSFITPPGLFSIILCVFALYSLKKPAKKLLSFILFLTSLSIYIISIPLTTFYLNRWLVDVYTPQLPPKDQPAAIIVLAGGSSKDENGKPFQPGIDTIERLYVGVKLIKENPLYSYLLLSGGDVYNRNGVTEAEIMASAVKIMGCSAKIILEDKSRNTEENLLYCAEIIRDLQINNIILVTNNYHIRRAMNFAYLYMPAGVKVYPYPSGGGISHNTGYNIDVFLPKMRALVITCIRLKEIIGLLLS